MSCSRKLTLTVIRYMARNQVVSGTLVDAKMEPVVSGGLPPAGVALVEMPGTNDAMFVARALRTDESAWSAPVRMRFATEFFSAVEGHETRLRETLAGSDECGQAFR